MERLFSGTRDRTLTPLVGARSGRDGIGYWMDTGSTDRCVGVAGLFRVVLGWVVFLSILAKTRFAGFDAFICAGRYCICYCVGGNVIFLAEIFIAIFLMLKKGAARS